MKGSRRQADVTTEKQAGGDGRPRDEDEALPEAEVTTERHGAAERPAAKPTKADAGEEHDGPDPLAGTRYRTICELGRGGMGRVYLAEHRELGRTFAVKVLSEELSSDVVVVERMRREARTASQIRHPGIVDVTDVGQTPDGRAFIVMEHLEGETLSKLIRREGRLEQLRALGIASRVCEALAAAHAHDVIHRDVKPANIVISGPEGREVAKIVDFGIALSPEHAAGRLTQLGTMPGTPIYMAPEQAITRSATVLTDVYAAGVVLYEMLTGSPPFEEPTAVETLARKLRNDPVAPSRRARKAGIDPAVDEVALRALARDPADRFQSMEALADAIDRAADEVRFGGRRRWPPARTVLVIGIALGASALAVGAGIAVVRSSRPGASTPAAPADVGGEAEEASVAVAAPSTPDAGSLALLRPLPDAGPSAWGAAEAGPDAAEAGWAIVEADAAGDALGPTGEGTTSMSRAERREAARRLAAEGRRHLQARRLGEARSTYLRAARLDSGNAEVQGGLGRVAFEQGRYGEAARHLERALDRSPRSTGLRVVLGSAYLRMGKTSHAVQQWERVLRQDPENGAAKRLLDSVR